MGPLFGPRVAAAAFVANIFLGRRPHCSSSGSSSIVVPMCRNDIPRKCRMGDSHLFSLQQAGDCMISISKSRSLEERYDEKDCVQQKALFQRAGDYLQEAGNMWTEDWMDVTVALGNAAALFYEISSVVESDSSSSQTSAIDCSPLPLVGGEGQVLYERIAMELEDASTINGCCSIGPPASVSNLEVIRDCFLELARLPNATTENCWKDEENKDKDMDKKGKVISEPSYSSARLFLEASEAISDLIDGIGA